MTQLLDYEITIIAYYTSPSLIVCQIQLIVPSKKKKKTSPLKFFFSCTVVEVTEVYNET